MQFDASVEILGKLATLGAVPIRRKTAQSFADFAKNIQAQFAGRRIAKTPDLCSGGSAGL